MTGKVTSIKDTYFFIKAETSQDVFAHRSVLVNASFSNLRVGQKVKFIMEDHPRGPRALEVAPVE